jgi:2-dehydro-3-deoxyglucarate aldolase/4-hydroxy-2-oxoheptanedioate aldolase
MPYSTSGKDRVAFWLQTASQEACEIAALARFDIIIFDGEHGIFTNEALNRLVPFCRSLGLTSYVRVAKASQPTIQTALDVGADGVILPQIRDLEHAKSVSAFAKYPPQGARGFGFNRTMKYSGVDDDFVSKHNREQLCFAMIETAGALKDVAEIASLDCVDGLFVGPSDLSLARGRGVFKSSEQDFADLLAIAGSAQGAGKLLGVAAPNSDYRRKAMEANADFIAVADELTAMGIGFQQLRSFEGQ